MRRIAVLLTMLGVAAALAAQAGAAGKPSIAIVKSSVKAGVVTVTVKVANWRLLPAQIGKKPNEADGGHWHLYIDGKYVAASGTLTAVTAKLPAGAHKLRAAANNDHSRLAPPVVSATVPVSVTASGVPVPGGTTDPGADMSSDGGGGMYGY